MIKEIRLKNWKSFEDAKLYIDPLTVLIGINASGKSNILDAITFLKKITLGKSITAAVAGDSESAGIRGGLEFLIKKDEKTAVLEVVVQSNADENIDFLYAIEIELVQKRQLMVISEQLMRIKTASNGTKHEKELFRTLKTSVKDATLTVIFLKKKQIDLKNSYSILNQIKALPLAKEVQEGVEEIVEHLSKSFLLDPIPSLMREYVPIADTLKSDASNVAGVLEGLETSKKERIEEILTAYLKRLPEKDITKLWTEKLGKFNSDAMLYCSEAWSAKNDLMVNARGMSDGTLRFVAIMTALLTVEEGSLLVIEEIDNGFHPSRARLLVEFLKEEGFKRKIDVLCTTHNPAFLDALGNEMVSFISVVHREEQGGASTIDLLEDIEELPRLLARGSLGKISANGAIEAALK